MLGTDLSFGPYALDPAAGRLSRNGEPLAVPASGIRILEALLEAKGGVVTKEYLLERGWPGAIVEEGNLSVQVAKLRDLLQSGAERGEWIVTVPRVGYRLLRQEKAAVEPAVPASAVKPSIAVLPFDKLGAADSQDSGADGLVEDLITGLSRFRTFAVVSRNSTFVYKGRAVDARQAATELGVRYLLEGSVRRAGDRVRITAQLIEGATGVHLWAEKFDGQLDDIFEFQDRITASVIGFIEPQIQSAEIERVRQKRPESFDAWDLYVQAVPLVHSAKIEDYDVALTLLDRAILLEPNYCPALTMASWAHERRRTYGGARDAPRAADHVRAAFALAQRAVEADRNDALALANLGWQRILFQRDAAGLAQCRRAVSLNPYHRSVLDLAAIAEMFIGDLDTTVLYAQRSVDLSPGAPDNYGCLAHISVALLFKGQFEEALIWAQRAVDLEPNYGYGHFHLAMALAYLGRIEEGKRELDAASDILPDVVSAIDPVVAPERRAVWTKGLRDLGVQT